MLALSRGEGQSIIIDGRIEVKIVKWSRSSVRLAIQAPREVTVDRDEIWRKMHPGEKSPLEQAELDRQQRLGAAGTGSEPSSRMPLGTDLAPQGHGPATPRPGSVPGSPPEIRPNAAGGQETNQSSQTGDPPSPQDPNRPST